MWQIDVLVEYTRIQQVFSYQHPTQLAPYTRVQVTFNQRELVGFVMHSHQNITTEFELLPIMEVIDEQPILNAELQQLAIWMEKQYLCSLMGVYQTMLPPNLKPASTHSEPQFVIMVQWLKDIILKNPRQQQALTELKQHGMQSRITFNKQYPRVLPVLLKHECVELIMEEKTYQPQALTTTGDLPLSEDQQTIFNQLIGTHGYQPYLLHGITGSGKSEVYLQLAKHYISLNQQVMILVPEIGLTPQMMELFKQRLGDHVAIYHSQLSNQEKYEQVVRVQQGLVKVVVATRSGVFMPFDNLGLIVMDEEHDDSYKQDKEVRYHARDIVLWRGAFHHCPVLLGSATPALESYARAIKGHYQLLELPQRVSGALPNIQLVDMQPILRHNPRTILSPALIKAMEHAFSLNQQVVLLLNRRGYYPMIKCQDCQTMMMCPHCDVGLVYHKAEHLLKCHLCGTPQPIPNQCPTCGGHEFLPQGLGTQRLVETVQQQFPQITILRMDRDATTRKGENTRILKAFANQEAQVLVGTQMIAKGLDFPLVTVVGILNGDTLLSRMDYRAQETTFDLLTQAAGRAGRQHLQSQVIIQTLQPQHFVLKCVKQQNYRQFFKQEMEFRHLAQYPPYTYLVIVRLSGKTLDTLETRMTQIKQELQSTKWKTIGPSPALKQQDYYQLNLTLKGKDLELMRQAIRTVMDHHPTWSLQIDVNPLHT